MGTTCCTRPPLFVRRHGSVRLLQYNTSVKIEIRCRDDTVPKTVDTRSHCKVWLRACNNLPQPPKNRDVGRGLRKIVACSQPYLAVASCIYSFWHGVIPTSYFIFNDFYTCFTHFSLTHVNISTNRGLPSPSTDGYTYIYVSTQHIARAAAPYIQAKMCYRRSCARSISENTHARNRTRDS